MRHSRSDALFIFGLISVAATGITAALMEPATGYEPSIYSATPLLFWIALIGAYLTGILLIAPLPPYLDHDLRGLGLVISSYALLFLLPVFRGYEILGRGGNDALAHIGYTKILMDQGVGNNWYPYLHEWLAVLRQVLGVDWQTSLSLTATVFTTAFLVGTALLLRRRSGDSQRFYTTAVAAAPLALGVFTRSTHPAIYSFFLIPFVLLATQLANKRSKAATLILIAAIVTAHPVSAALLAVMLVIGWIWQPEGAATSMSGGWIPILGIGAVAWYSSFSEFSKPLLAIVSVLNRGAAAESKTEAATSFPLEYVVRRAVEIYGSFFIVVGLGGLAAVVVLYQYYRKRDNLLGVELSSHFAAAGLVAVAFLFLPLIVASPLRASRYLVFAAVLLVGLAYPLSKGRRADVARGFCVALILVSAVISVGAVYKPNKQLTEAELQGSDWFIEHRSDELDSHSHQITYKTQLYLEGENDWVFSTVSDVPDRLGQEDGTIQDNLKNETYLITRQSDREAHTWYPRSQWDRRIVYTSGDVQSLRSDSAIDLVYSNGEYEVWVVQ
jgi:hypothetical protein